ncbi:MAG: hypothetical protein ABIH99_05650 [Candidatus Micrarchaeota archaeon]
MADETITGMSYESTLELAESKDNGNRWRAARALARFPSEKKTLSTLKRLICDSAHDVSASAQDTLLNLAAGNSTTKANPSAILIVYEISQEYAKGCEASALDENCVEHERLLGESYEMHTKLIGTINAFEREMSAKGRSISAEIANCLNIVKESFAELKAEMEVSAKVEKQNEITSIMKHDGIFEKVMQNPDKIPLSELRDFKMILVGMQGRIEAGKPSGGATQVKAKV